MYRDDRRFILTDMANTMTLLKLQRRRIIVVLSGLSMVASFVFFLMNLEYGDILSLISLGVLFLGSAACALMAWHQNLNIAAGILVVLAFIAVTLSVYDGDGLFDPGIIGYILIILLAGLTLGKRAIVPISLAALAAIGGISVWQSHGSIQPTINAQDGGNWLPLSILIASSGIVLWFIISQLEENARKMEAIQMERVDTLGFLIRGLAHELNTPLGNARMAISSLDVRNDIADNPEIVAILDSSITKSIVLVSRLRDFMTNSEHADVITRSPEDLFDLVQHHHPGITIIDDVSHGLSATYILAWDVVQFILEELLSNAKLHSDWNETRLIVRNEAHFLQFTVQSPGGLSGVDDDRDEIFKPFYTTRRYDGCAGLGLFFARQLAVSILNGWLEYRQETDRQSSFVLTVPIP